MADEDVQYEFKSVQTVRGTESRSIAKWEGAGWELVGQEKGKVRSTLSFRRPKPKAPWKLVAAAVGAGVVLLAAVGIASALGGGHGQGVKAGSQSAISSASETPSEAPSGRPSSEPSASDDAVAEQALTPANNQQFAGLLRADYCSGSIGRFARQYADRTIEFNGSVENIASRGAGRYDITLGPGDKGPHTVDGPVFKYAGVGMSDLHFPGDKASIGTGDRLHVVATVGTYDATQCLFYLDPVSTESR